MNHNLMPVAYAAAADPFTKSPYNPLNMSRSGTKRTTGHAPSTRILERVRDAASDLALLAATTQGWKFVAEKNRAMVYEMNGRALPPAVSTTQTFGAGGGHVSDYYLVRAVTTVHANIPAVLDLLHARTTDELVPKMKSVFGKHLVRGVVVDELSCTTPPPFADDPDSATGARKSFSDDDAYSVTWLALQGPSTSLSGSDKMQDFTMVCYQDGFEREDRGGVTRIGRGAVQDRTLLSASGHSSSKSHASKLLGVHVFSSVNFKDLPALPASQHTDRQHLRTSGFVVEATNDPHAFRLSLFLSLLPTKSTLKYARRYQKWLQSLASDVGNVARAVQASTKVEISFGQLGKRAWKTSDHCYICLKMFRTFRRCHHCRLCGEAVCSACSGFVSVSTGGASRRAQRHSHSQSSSFVSHDDCGDDSSGFTTETRGCTVCLQTVAQQSASLVLSARKSSGRSSSSFSDAHSSIAPPTNSVVSLGDDAPFGDESDCAGSGLPSTGHASFQSYYDHRKRSTGGMTSASYSTNDDDSASVTSQPRKLLQSDHHTTKNTPSMSTTSSSFSRTSHEGDGHAAYYSALPTNYSTEQQQSRQFAPSFSSEVSDGSGDLSMNPDILALAGLTLKPSAAPPQHVRSVAEDHEDSYDDAFDPSATHCSTGVVGNGGFGWSGGNDTSAPAPAPLPVPAPVRPDASTDGPRFHFSVMSSASASSAPPKSSVHAEIAALMLQDLATSGPSNGAAGPFGRPPTVATSSSASLASSMRSTTSGGFGHAPPPSASFNPSASGHSHTSSSFAPPLSFHSSSKIISAASLAASQHQRTAAAPANDMILLSTPAPPSPEFVVFDTAQRESIFVRPGDGSDMIPLDLLSSKV